MKFFFTAAVAITPTNSLQEYFMLLCLWSGWLPLAGIRAVNSIDFYSSSSLAYFSKLEFCDLIFSSSKK